MLEPPMLIGGPDDDPGELTVAPRFRRTAIGVAVVAVVVLIAAALAGGSSTGPDEVEAAVEISVAQNTTSTTPADAPTTAPPASATVAPPTSVTERTFEAIEVVTDVPPPEGRLVLWRATDPIVRIIDLAASSTLEVDFDALGLDLVRSIRGVGHRAVVDGRQGFWWLDSDGGAGVLAEGGVLRAYGDDEVWISAAFVNNRSFEPLRVGLDGVAQLGPTLPPGVGPFGYVGDRLLAGGGVSGGVYIENSTGWDLMADGALIAAGDLFLLTKTCDESLQCSLVRRDMMTGVETVHELPADIDLFGIWWVDQLASPDTQRLIVSSTTDGSALVWDLLDDSFTSVPILPGRELAWSSDGSWLFVAAPNGVVGVDLVEGRQLTIPLTDDGVVGAGWSLAWLDVPPDDAAVPSNG